MPAKVVLVTGASSGIGEATCLQLIKDGYIVYGAARRVSSMQGLAAKGVRIIKLDVTDDTLMQAAIAEIIDAEGRIDGLINNAGYGSYGSVEEVPLSEARRQIEVNIFGLARLTQLVIPYMRSRKSGTIINVSSVGGSIYTPLGAWYHATKHAVEGFSDALRFELEPFGINVVIVAPGGIKTQFMDVVNAQMTATSGHGPYANLVQGIVKVSQREGFSPPLVIARVMARALKAKRPKTRYRAGSYARTLIVLRRLLGDRGFDNLLRSQLKS